VRKQRKGAGRRLAKQLVAREQAIETRIHGGSDEIAI
jgi:hypothetical protein